jgi:YMGG-like Gly-zipper
MMKKILGTTMCLILLGVTTMPALAQTPRGRDDRRATESRRYYDEQRDNRDWRYNERSVWNTHRDKITVAAGAGAGALIGALAGGKKGAIIGALVGAGSSALYTYKLRDRDNRRYHNRRH